jgi:gliding motility-associated-like protein
MQAIRMRPILLKFFALIGFLTLFQSMDGSHVLGGNITWECLGGDQYQITYTQYRECLGTNPALSQETVFLFPEAGCSFPTFADLTFVSEVEISDLCPVELATSACINYFNPNATNGGITPGVTELVYTGVVTLAGGCDWTVVWSDNYWNYFNNIDWSTYPFAYIYSTINTSVCTNSVDITSVDAPYECINSGNTSHQITVDNPAGYTLSYALTTPLTVGSTLGSSVSVPGYTPFSGITVSPTGLISFSTTGATPGNYLIDVQITMTDSGGNVVGVLTESFPVVMRDCSPTTTDFELPEVQSVDWGIVEGPTSIGVCAGDSLCFSFLATNSNTDRQITFTETHPAALNAGNPTLVQSGLNPANGEFCMITDDTMIGTHTIHIEADDNACTLPGHDDLFVTVTVYPNVSLSATDTIICQGQSLTITANGGTTYNWSVLSGDLDPGFDGNVAVQILEDITQDTQIEVSIPGVPASCNATEVLNVGISLQTINPFVVDESCLQNDGTMDVTVFGANGSVATNYTYVWSNGGSTTNQITGLTAGNYCCDVTDPTIAGCTIQVCATVGTTPPPGGTIEVAGGNATTICQGGQATIDFLLTGTGPWVVNGTGAGIAWPLTVNSLPFSLNVSPTVNTTYTLTSVSYLNTPACITNVNVPITVDVRSLATATFQQAGPLCAGETTPLTVDISEPGNFNVTWSANPTDPASAPDLPASPWTDNQILNGVNPAQTTVYSITDVQYTSAPFCPNPQNNTMTIVVNPLPTIDLTTSTPLICTGDQAVLDLALTGTPNWSVNGTGAGITWPVTGLTNANSQITVSPAATTNFCITSVTDGNNCSATVNDCETVTITSNVTPSVTIAASTGTTICAGSSVTFTANPIDGGSTPSYQWYLNSLANPVGSNSATYTTTTLANGNSVFVVMTSSLGCVTSATATSNTLVFTVNPVVVPSVSINTNPVGSICAGTSVTFTAVPNNGGFAPGPTYQWNLNNNPVPGETGNTFTSTTLQNGDVVTVTMVSGAACPSLASVTSANVNMTVNPVLVPSVSIVENPAGTICAGASVTFTATPVNPGAGPTYNWLVNGNPAPGATNSTTYTTTTLNDNDVVSAELISNALCASPISVNSNTITITVSAQVTPSVTIAAAPSGAICQGTSVTYTATPINGGTAPTYQWYLNGGPAGVGSTFTSTSLNSGDNVYVEMTSNAGCVTQATGTSVTTTMTVNPLPTASLSGSAEICQGTTHTFNVTYTGTALFSNVEIWNATTGVLAQNIGGSNTFTTGTAGDYYISTVTDANGCTNTTDSPIVSLSVNVLPTATLSGAAAICADGTHTFDIDFTGEADYDYTISLPGGGTAGPFNTLTNSASYTASVAGNYAVASVTDNNGCQSSAASASVLLTVNPLPTSTMSADATICAGQTHDFTVTFTGSAPYTYSMTTPGGNVNPPNAGGNTATYTASAAGNYGVTTVTDSNGCTSIAASNVAVLTVNALPTATFSANASTCTGTCFDFTITLTGQAPWNFEVIGPNGADPSNPINSATASYTYAACDEGDYYVTTITDLTGCSNNVDSPLANLNILPLPTAAWVTTDTSFCQGTSVEVELDLTGTGPFDIFINGAAAPTWTEATTTHVETISVANTYCIDQVTDATGCSSQPLDCIIVDEILTPVVDAGADLAVCVGSDIIIGTAAVAGQTYEWVDPTGILGNLTIADPTANSPFTGTFTLEVTAFNQYCPATDDMELTVNALPVVSIVADDDVICYNSTAELTASGAISYAWAAAASLLDPLNTNPMNVQPLVTETFTVTGTDANGCQSDATIEIEVGTELLVNEVFPPDICFGVCDGSIELTPSGSFGGYVLDWASPNPDMDDYFEEELCAGVYDYTITDVENCVFIGSVTMNPLPYNHIDAVVVTPPACYGEPTGQIDVIDNLAVTYNITGPQILTNGTGVFPNISAGPFNVLVTDALGCISDSAIVVNSVNPQIIVTPTVFTTPFCFEAAVPFAVSTAGGSGNFTIHWHNCEEINCEIGINSPFDLILDQDTTLYFYAEDLGAPGCFSDTLSVSAFLNPPITMTIMDGVDALTICDSECIDLTADVNGGNGGVTVEWFESPNDITTAPFATGPDYTICPDATVQYYAYASDGCNPPAYDYLDVTVFQTPEVTFTTDTLEGCYPLVVTFENTTDPALVGNCLWDMGNGVTLPVCGTITYTYAQLGEFTPSLLVTSADGCSDIDSLDTPIIIHGYPEIEFEWEPSSVSVLEPAVQFINQTLGGSTYEWEFSTLGTSEEVNPAFEFPRIDLAVYPVCLMSETEFGCRDTVCHDIVIESIFQIFAPNAFTPDQDGRNEVWLPVVTGVDPTAYTLWIYDRWGNMIFTTTNPEQAWTGNVNNGTYYSQIDTFMWRIEAKRLSDGTFEVREGYVTVIR